MYNVQPNIYNVYTEYIQLCKYMFVHTMYIHVHTGIYRNILLQNMFIPDIYMYIDGIFKFLFL